MEKGARRYLDRPDRFGGMLGLHREKFTLNVEDPWALTWIKDTEQGRAWAAGMGFEWPITFVPKRECKASDPRPQILFAGMNDNQTITHNPLDIYAVINATANFQSFRLDWGTGDDPQEWETLVDDNSNQYKNPERIHTWDLSEVPAGRITLRLKAKNTDGDLYAERRIHLNLNVPTPTPTATPTVTLTPTPTKTPVPTKTPAAHPRHRCRATRRRPPPKQSRRKTPRSRRIRPRLNHCSPPKPRQRLNRINHAYNRMRCVLFAERTFLTYPKIFLLCLRGDASPRKHNKKYFLSRTPF